MTVFMGVAMDFSLWIDSELALAGIISNDVSQAAS